MVAGSASPPYISPQGGPVAVRLTSVGALDPTYGAGGVAGGGFHTLGVDATGRAWAWGWNVLGQLVTAPTPSATRQSSSGCRRASGSWRWPGPPMAASRAEPRYPLGPPTLSETRAAVPFGVRPVVTILCDVL
jgi:hypothetical protein